MPPPSFQLREPSSLFQGDQLPDLGGLLIATGMSQGQEIVFANVPIANVGFLAHDHFCSTVWHGAPLPTHAATFDFGHKELRQVLSVLDPSERASLLLAQTGRRLPFFTKLPRCVVVATVVCRLGTAQRSRSWEVFVPLTIRSMTVETKPSAKRSRSGR